MMIINSELPKESLQSLLYEKKQIQDELDHKSMKLTERIKKKKRMMEIDKKLSKYDSSIH